MGAFTFDYRKELIYDRWVHISYGILVMAY